MAGAREDPREPRLELKAKAANGSEYAIPKAVRGRYVPFTLWFDVAKDWNLIQLVYSLPPRTRSRMVRDMLRIVVNAAHLWLEKAPVLQIKHGKKLTEEQRRRLLRTRLSLA